MNSVPQTTYTLDIYKVGYRCNDAFSSYLSLGKPSQLTKNQVDVTKSQNDGTPISKKIISIKAEISFFKKMDIRENDVYFLNLTKL